MQPEGAPTPQPSGGSLPTPLAIGQLVGHGRYELKRMLDKGGMSSVWLAEDSRLHEHVALKFLPPEIRDDPAALKEMQRETTKSRKLSHPNIIRIYDLHESPDELPFISMEFIRGDNLHNLSAVQPQGFFTWEQLKPWLKQLCDALTYAHGEGVVHRDLKPANMMVDEKGRLKLADFGIAMTMDESKRRGNTNPINGTLGYMSPQQMSGQPAHVTDDIHALGATLYELLTSRPAFHTGDVYAQVMNDLPKPVNVRLWELGLDNQVPAEVDSLIMACLAKIPSHRPANAKQVAQWAGLRYDQESGGDSIAQAVSLSMPETKREADVTGQKPGRSKLIWAAVMGILLLALIATTLIFRQFKQPEQAGNSAPVESSNSGLIQPTPTTNAAATPGSITAEKPPARHRAGMLDERFKQNGWPDRIVFASVRNPDGSYIVGGNFTTVGTNVCSRIARYDADGILDPGFNRHGSMNDEVYAIVRLPDGKLLVGGQFATVYGQNTGHLVRLHPDGSLDKTFPVTVPDEYVHTIVLQPDGKILIGGKFQKLTPGKKMRSRIARLNADGTIDESFASTTADDAVDRIFLQKDGRIIVGGKFTRFNGAVHSHIVRLKPDGTVDPTFSSGQGFNGNVLALEMQADDKIWVGGTFTKYGGAPANYLVRLNPNGSRDRTFLANPGDGPNAFIGVICREGPDLFWVGGNYSLFSRNSRSRIVRLKTDGSLDPDFHAVSGMDGSVRSFSLVPGDSMLATGNFKSYGGLPRPHVIRVYAGASAAP